MIDQIGVAPTSEIPVPSSTQAVADVDPTPASGGSQWRTWTKLVDGS